MAKLYDRYSRPVYSLAMTVLREPRAAEDVVQDAFLTFWRRPESYVDSRGAFGPWILRVARNRAIDIVRRRSREHYESGEETTSILDRLVDPEPEPSDQLWSETVAGNVRRAVVQLTAPQREVIELAYFRGMTQSEMATHLGIPLGTIKTRVRTALRRLAEILDEAEVRSQWNDAP